MHDQGKTKNISLSQFKAAADPEELAFDALIPIGVQNISRTEDGACTLR